MWEDARTLIYDAVAEPCLFVLRLGSLVVLHQGFDTEPNLSKVQICMFAVEIIKAHVQHYLMSVLCDLKARDAMDIAANAPARVTLMAIHFYLL